MAEPFHNEEPKGTPNIRKEEPTYVHNVRQLLGCLPVVGSVAVGICGLVAFGVGLQHTGRVDQPGWSWLLAGSVGLIASGIGFGVLAWLVWANRDQ